MTRGELSRGELSRRAASPPLTLGLAITTVGRPTLERLLRSVAASSMVPAVVAVANQSGRPLPVITSDLPFPVRVVTSSGGASRGRNHAVFALDPNVDIIGFPNDDIVYPLTTLERVVEAFVHHPDADALACSLVEDGRPRFVLPAGRPLDRLSVWRALEATTFVRRSVFTALNGFREDLGTGCATPWQSGEGTDLLLRVLERGGVVLSRPDIGVTGQGERRNLDERAFLAKHRAYARGTGRVYRIHPYPHWIRARLVLAPWLRLRRFGSPLPLSLRLALVRSVGRIEGLLGRTLPRSPGCPRSPHQPPAAHP